MEEPRKKKKVELPDPLMLMVQANPPPFLKKPESPPAEEEARSTAATIAKPAILYTKKYDPIDQYDYFAQSDTAILDRWKSTQHLSKRERNQKDLLEGTRVVKPKESVKYVKVPVKRWQLPAKK